MTDRHFFLESGHSRARITDRGAALTQLQLAGKVLIADFDTSKKVFGGSILAPWPNRIRSGAYKFDGHDYKLPLNEDRGNANHGLVFDQPATVSAVTESQITLLNQVFESAGYPSSLDVETTYSLGASELKVRQKATNTGSQNAPVGLGAHPYFLCDESSEVQINASTMWIHDSTMIPEARIDATTQGFDDSYKLVSALELDNQFEDLQRISARLKTNGIEVEIWQDDAPYLMAYVAKEFAWTHGSGLAIALEPQTCAVDAFNSKQGLRVLKPGESTSMSWGVRVAS